MNNIIPFNKVIKFDTQIAEITSISLEHELSINDQSLLGNFVIYGEYKEHPVSVNTLPFNYHIPFDVSFPKPMIRETIEFAINDFRYEIKDGNCLDIKIEIIVKGQEQAENITVDDTEEELYNPELIEDTANNDTREDVVMDNNNEQNENIIQSESKNQILNFNDNGEETFITYNIHILKQNETLEGLCSKYNQTEDIISMYNDISNLKLGDKIIIPVDE